VVPELVAEAGGMWPPVHFRVVRDAFATPANQRFPAYWTKEDDAFAQPWDYATAGPLWANPPFSRLEVVLAKAARERSLMLIIALEWPGTQYPWWTTLCAVCPRRWQLPQDRPLYLRVGTDLMPAPRWHQVRGNLGLPAGRLAGVAGTRAPAPPANPPPTGGPPREEGALGH